MTEIDKKQQKVIDDFVMLEENIELTLEYIMEIGQNLPPILAKYQKEEYLVKGCQSKVWLGTECHQSRVKFYADSNAMISKGLVGLLIGILDNETPEDIIKSKIFFPKEMGMSRFIGTQRSIGFDAMVARMKKDVWNLKINNGKERA